MFKREDNVVAMFEWGEYYLKIVNVANDVPLISLI
jgi:hypothetical protein